MQAFCLTGLEETFPTGWWKGNKIMRCITLEYIEEEKTLKKSPNNINLTCITLKILQNPPITLKYIQVYSSTYNTWKNFIILMNSIAGLLLRVKLDHGRGVLWKSVSNTAGGNSPPWNIFSRILKDFLRQICLINDISINKSLRFVFLLCFRMKKNLSFFIVLGTRN